MSEPSNSPAPRATLLAAIAEELPQVVPGWRWIAQDLLAEASRIDLFGADADGVAVIVGVGSGPGDVALLGRILAQRHWLLPRLSDWLKLAPSLGVRPDQPLRALLVCDDPGPELCAAVASLALPWLQLVRRHAQDAGRLRPGAAVLERLGSDPAPPARGAGNGSPPTRRPELPPAAPFRTGLTDADLGLSPVERAEFERVEPGA